MQVTRFKYVYLKYEQNLFENKTFVYNAIYNILETLQYSEESLIVLKIVGILENSQNSRNF